MNQLLLGALPGLLLGLVLFACRRCRASLRTLILVPCLALAGAIWAIVPDLPRLFGRQDLYFRLMRDPRCDIFFWHYTIDLHEHDSIWYVAAFSLLAAALLFIAWHELHAREKETGGPS